MLKNEEIQDDQAETINDNDILVVDNLIKVFKSGHVRNYALDGVSFSIKKGETLAVVGESGSGKTTLGLSVMRLQDITSGQIKFRGKNIEKLRNRQLWDFRSRSQMVFQDPYSSLNPYNTIYKSVIAPFLQFDNYREGEEESTTRSAARGSRRSATEKRKIVADMLDKVGLSPGESFLDLYPRKLSGGQRQRVSLARSLITRPELIVADEPTSMLDVSISSQVINLLKQLKKEMEFSIMYISHELATSKYMSDRMAVMNLGRIVEIGDSEAVALSAAHPYTDLLVKSMPDIEGFYSDKPQGSVDFNAYNGGMKGCTFAHSCPFKTEICETERPKLKKIDANHYVACFHPVGR